MSERGGSTAREENENWILSVWSRVDLIHEKRSEDSAAIYIYATCSGSTVDPGHILGILGSIKFYSYSAKYPAGAP